MNHRIRVPWACTHARVFSFLALSVLTFTTSAATLITKDGKTFEGTITAASADELKVTPTSGSPTTVKLADLRSATFAKPTTAPTQLPKWTHADLGKVHLPGSATESDGVFTLSASGWGLWGPRDSGHIVSFAFEGDAQLIAHAATSDDEHGGARAAVFFRSSLDPDANFAAAVLYPSGEVRLNRRPIEGWPGAPEGSKLGPAQAWIRIARAGDTLTAYRSKDGRFWQTVATQTVPLGDKPVAGLFVSSGTNSRLATATFDHVQFIPGTPAAAYFPGSAGPATGIVLTDGSMLAGWTDFVSDGQIRFWPHFGADGREIAKPKNDTERTALKPNLLVIPADQVARLRFAPEPPDLDTLAPPNTPGVLLRTGDFVEGEIDHLTYGTYLDLKSVLFGAKRVEPPKEAISVILHPTTPARAAYEVKTRDGSILQADTLTFDNDAVTAHHPTLGDRKFPLAELVSVER